MSLSARWILAVCMTLSFATQALPRSPMVDGDADGVSDERDDCPYTEVGIRVNASGCPLISNDGDADAVLDTNDACPYSPAGSKVDRSGCAVDSDFDGVADGLDACPDSVIGQVVLITGCAAGEVAKVKIGVEPTQVVDAAMSASKPGKKPKAKAMAALTQPENRRPDAASQTLIAATAPIVVAKTQLPPGVQPPSDNDRIKAETRGVATKMAGKPAPAVVAEAPTPVIAKPSVAAAAMSKAADLRPPSASDQSQAEKRESPQSMAGSASTSAAAKSEALPPAAPAAAPMAQAKMDEVRPPSQGDKIKAEKPSAAYLAAQAAKAAGTNTMPSTQVAAPPAVAKTGKRSKSGKAAVIASAPEIVMPSAAPVAPPTPPVVAAPATPIIVERPVAAVSQPVAPAAAELAKVEVPAPAIQPPAESQVAALLDSLREEAAEAVPAGKTPVQAARDAGERPETPRLTVPFKRGGTEISDLASSQVRTLANGLSRLMEQNPAMSAALRGFAAKGEPANLAERRLVLTRALLMARGIDGTRVTMKAETGGLPRVEIEAKP